MEPLWAAVMGFALIGCCLLAYSLRILDARGSVMAFVLGAAILWAGGLAWFALMVVFTGIAFVATRLGRRRKESHGTAEAQDGERGAPNVIANGAAPALAAMSILVVDPATAAVAYSTAVAAIMSDTLASEIGGLAQRTRRIIPPFERRAPGTNGSVSWVGQAAALAGPVAIAAAAMPLAGITMFEAGIVVAAGFIGSQVDSILGATLEKDPDFPDRPLGKGEVNFIASLAPTLAILAAFHWAATV